jgi:hypothetical protein
LCLLMDDNNDNPIILRPHIVFTDGRQQRQPNHNTTTYCSKHNTVEFLYNEQVYNEIRLIAK